jgi:hypothetical protein
VAALALLGFLALIMIGPIIALVSVFVSLAFSALAVLLPLALLGLVIWLPYQVLSGDPHGVWRQARGWAIVIRDRVGALLGYAFRIGRWGYRRTLVLAGFAQPVVKTVGGAALDLGKRAADEVRTQAPVVAEHVVRGGTEAIHQAHSLAVQTVPWFRYVAGVAAEVLAGAGVGGLLLALMDLGHAHLEERIALGAGIGALIGLLVAVLRSRPQAQAAERS